LVVTGVFDPLPPIFEPLPPTREPLPPFDPAGWRVEVKEKGRYWCWRKGIRAARQSRYGGKFDLLSEERQAEYGRNKARRG
jgi:hypothetical protein